MQTTAAPVTYEDIKRLAEQLERPALTLIALAPANDPFYVTGYRQALAQWFKTEVWDRLVPDGDRVHVRRLHYLLVSLPAGQRTKSNGTPYENTLDDWHEISCASLAARQVGLVDADRFVDRRAGEPTFVFIPDDEVTGAALVVSGDEPKHPPAEEPVFHYTPCEYAFPASFPLPVVIPPEVAEPYALEIWCEKSTMNDILEPLAQAQDVTLITGVGELSHTHCNDFVERVLAHRRGTRILYISDFDPAGAGMPVSVARKIEHIIRRDGHDALDIRLDPLVLTAEQVRRYRLPRVPIKDSDRRKALFESQHGTGAVELDALEALHPGVLRRIVEAAIKVYRAPVRNARAEIKALVGKLQRHAWGARDEVLAGHAEDIDALRAKFEQMQAAIKPHQDALVELAAEFEVRSASHVAAINDEVEQFYDSADLVWQAIATDIADAAPDVDEVDWPEVGDADESDDPLFDSGRDYVTQIDRYKRHQGKPTQRRNGGAP